MANKDRPRGFEPSGPLLRLGEYQAGGVTYPGEMVYLDSSGQVTVGAATATSALLGVAQSLASSAGVSVMVADDPNQKFVVQVDDASVSQQTDINLNYTVLATGEDATYKISRMELDGSAGGTTAALSLKILGIEKSVGNSLGSTVDVIVTINNHQLGGGTGTAGI